MALKRRPTAVVCTNDVFAVGAMVACREQGVRIPEEISITGVGAGGAGCCQSATGRVSYRP
jgi:LacI family transcriptional regulator